MAEPRGLPETRDDVAACALARTHALGGRASGLQSCRAAGSLRAGCLDGLPGAGGREESKQAQGVCVRDLIVGDPLLFGRVAGAGVSVLLLRGTSELDG